MSSNGLIKYKSKHLSFINKGGIELLWALLMIVIIPCSYFLFEYWSEIPLSIKIFGTILLVIIFIKIIITLLNGMVITKNGTIFFMPDFRLKILNVQDLTRLSFNFNECENNKYSVTVKLVYKDSKVFIKDYSKKFKTKKIPKLAMSMYTITKRKVDVICEKLLDLNICIITTIDKNSNIIYQNIQTKSGSLS